jgi:hypothetical protein
MHGTMNLKFEMEGTRLLFPYISPSLSIFSLPALEELFLLLLSILSWNFLFVSSLTVRE